MGYRQEVMSRFVSKVSELTGAPVEDILSKRRYRQFTQPRHVAIYVLFRSRHFTSDEIANFFGRDRSSVSSSCASVDYAWSNKRNPFSRVLDEWIPVLMKYLAGVLVELTSSRISQDPGAIIHDEKQRLGFIRRSSIPIYKVVLSPADRLFLEVDGGWCYGMWLVAPSLKNRHVSENLQRIMMLEADSDYILLEPLNSDE